MRILMVCLGNICRSPLAEGIMQDKIAAHGLDWTVESAGTGSWHVGQRPDGRALAVARQHGLDLSAQRGCHFQPADFERFDHILVMDDQNRRDVLRLARTAEHREKVELILNHSHPGRDLPVPDPYYDDDGFEAVFQMLDVACEAFVRRYSSSAAL